MHVISDTHFDHIAIARSRGFNSTQEHDDWLLDHINSTVLPKGRLKILGDFAWKRAGHFRSRIKCKNVDLIYGNHDKRSVGSLFTSAKDADFIRWDGHKIYLSHYATAFWPSSHHGSLHLYGHTHNQRESTLDEMMPGRRSMDVGVDALLSKFGSPAPIHFDKVVEILSKERGHDHVEWYAKRSGRHQQS